MEDHPTIVALRRIDADVSLILHRLWELFSSAMEERTARKIAMALSIVGSLFVALNIRIYSLIAFSMWAVSNVIWFMDALSRNDKEQICLYFWFTLTSLLGIYTSLI